MPNPWFQFKQFTVWHDKCGMKVGTDGVLLGAWVDTENSQSVLDVGTGTGLIALMLAQRTQSAIDAIELEEDAANQAIENFKKSKWAKRLVVYNGPVQLYAKSCTKKYDLIVSNPPFFSSDHKAPDAKRAVARHTDTLPLSELVKTASGLITDSGRFAVIIPIELRSQFIDFLAFCNFWIIRETLVIPAPNKSPIRILYEVSKNKPVHREIDKIVIREKLGGDYSAEFKQLTRDFYLAF